MFDSMPILYLNGNFDMFLVMKDCAVFVSLQGSPERTRLESAGV